MDAWAQGCDRDMAVPSAERGPGSLRRGPWPSQSELRARTWQRAVPPTRAACGPLGMPHHCPTPLARVRDVLGLVREEGECTPRGPQDAVSRHRQSPRGTAVCSCGPRTVWEEFDDLVTLTRHRINSQGGPRRWCRLTIRCLLGAESALATPGGANARDPWQMVMTGLQGPGQ